jgi:hypothetical protein
MGVQRIISVERPFMESSAVTCYGKYHFNVMNSIELTINATQEILRMKSILVLFFQEMTIATIAAGQRNNEYAQPLIVSAVRVVPHQL